MVIMCSSCSNLGFRFCSSYDQIRVHNIRLVQICRNAERGEKWNFTSKKSFGQGESALLWIQLCAKGGGLTKWFNIDYGLPPLNHQIVVLFVGLDQKISLFLSLKHFISHIFSIPPRVFAREIDSNMQGKFHESIASPAAPLLFWSEAIELHKKLSTRTLWDWIQTLSLSLDSQNLWGMYCWHRESKQGMLAACRTGAPYFVVSSNLWTYMQFECSHPSSVVYFFSNPKIGTAIRWETTNSNPCAPIDLSSQATVGARY